MNCPNCGTSARLAPCQCENIEIDQCKKCQGHWLDPGELQTILKNEIETFTPELIEKTIQASFQGIPEEELAVKKSCPKCQKPMRGVKFSYHSGIILDRCMEGHGIWLDHKELDKLQAHHEHWNQEVNDSQEKWNEMVKNVESNFKIKRDEDLKKLNGPVTYMLVKLGRVIFGKQ